MELNNLLHLFQTKEKDNNYDTIEEINDNIAILISASIENIPIFYRNNIIVIKQEILYKLIKARKEESVRAGIYIFLCMLALHAPVVPISADYRKGEITENENISVACVNSAAINKNVLKNSFGLHRNTISKGMKFLHDILDVVELPNKGYVFTYPANESPDKWNTSNLRYQLNSIVDAIETIQHADFYSRINPDDYIGAENAEFASIEDADYAIHNILDDPLVPESWKKTLTTELERQENSEELELNTIAMTLTKLFAEVPLVSRCKNNYFLIRQEMLEYILLHGYLPTNSILEETSMNKAASVILLHIITKTDELGYICKDNRDLGLMQMKDIAIDCNLKLPAVSYAMKYWIDIGIISECSENGVYGYKFSNQLWIEKDGNPVSYLLHRKILKENLLNNR